MTKQIVLSFLGLALIVAATPAADAQNMSSTTGTFGRSSSRTSNYRFPNAAATMNQALPGVKQAGLGGLAPVFGGGGRNGLPRTELSGFVRGGNAEAIYGDEGADGIPPYFEFTAQHRIQRGIQSNGLTTGHGSVLPAAWGGDEFCKGSEFSMSGQQGGGTPAATQGAAGGNGMRAMFPIQGMAPQQGQQQGQQGQMLNGQQFVNQFRNQFGQP